MKDAEHCVFLQEGATGARARVSLRFSMLFSYFFPALHACLLVSANSPFCSITFVFFLQSLVLLLLLLLLLLL